MTRQGVRVRIGKCLYRDATGLAAIVNVGHETRERRFPLDTPRNRIKTWQDETRAELRKIVGDSPVRGTFAADAARYLKLVDGMKGIKERTKQIDEWVAVFGHRQRDRIKAAEVRQQLETWRAERGWEASTLNHRRTALQHLWSVLDGKGERNPVRSVPRYRPPAEEARGLTYPVIQLILKAMPPSVTRLRLAIIAHTGLPHATLMKLTRADVDWRARTYRRPGRLKGKGTQAGVMPLSRKAAGLFRLLNRVGGWGTFSTSSMRTAFIRGCRAAERAAAKAGETLDLSGVRPYDLRHSFGSAVYQATHDLQATAELLGHRSFAMTRRYTRSAVPEALTDGMAKVERILARKSGTGKGKKKQTA